VREIGAGERNGLLAIFALSLLLSVLFALRVPLQDGSNPDETAHVEYVRLLLEKRGFVEFQTGDPLLSETHQPPLYYLLSVPVYAATGGNLVAVRLVSGIIQLLTILVAFRAGKDLFPSRPYIALGAAAFVAFLPTQAQLSGAVNNDGLTTLLCALLFWRMGLLVKDGIGSDLKGAALMGLFLGLGLWTKLTVIQLIPTLLLAYLIAWKAEKLSLTDAAKGFIVLMGTAILVASPWLIRNTLLYGDPLTLKIFPLTAPPNTPTPKNLIPAVFPTMTDYLRTVGIRSYASFWYIVPPNMVLPDAPRLITVGLSGLIGLIGALRPTAQGGVTGGERRAMLLSLTGVLLIVPFFIRFILQFFQAQGRYFLPGLLPVALLCCLGWAIIGRDKGGKGMVIALNLILLALALFQVSLYGS